MDKEKRIQIEKFVIEFMNEHYFKIDENNQSLYTSETGHHVVNMKAMFEEIIEDYVEQQSSDAVQFAKWMLTQVNIVEELYEIFKNQNK